MLGRTTGAVLLGVEACLVEVEVDLGGGLPAIVAVGLPDTAVREGIDRLRAALRHAGFQLPQRRILINLAPAELRKQGTGLDLPVAVALLAADGQIPVLQPHGTVLVGELGLDGMLRPVRGVLAVALAAREAGRRRLVVPEAHAEEAAVVEGIETIGVSSLAEVAALARGRPARPTTVSATRLLQRASQRDGAPDLEDVRGQASARRALEVAAAGGHNLLFSGPPGSGKTMLARRLPGILPPMAVKEALEVTRVWSAAGLARGLVTRRPFRAPHHGVSLAGMTGGGRALTPGEVSLATRGVLYLDELPEFRRDVLEALRQPLEDGVLVVSRVHARTVFPARGMLVASMNPCPCGYHGDPAGRCGCSPAQVRRYLARLSGPLLDRFDLLVEVPAVKPEDLGKSAPGESSQRVRERVIAARKSQRVRFGAGGPTCNARMEPPDVERHARLDPGPLRILTMAASRLGLSARAFHRIRRVARTLADLEGRERIGEGHVAEAIQYRRMIAALPGGRPRRPGTN